MIRFAEEKDTRAVRALFDLCFPDESGFNAYYFEHIYRPERTLLYTQEDKLCAMVQMLPYQLSMNGIMGEATYGTAAGSILSGGPAAGAACVVPDSTGGVAV